MEGEGGLRLWKGKEVWEGRGGREDIKLAIAIIHVAHIVELVDCVLNGCDVMSRRDHAILNIVD